ncbi:MAG: hypothetical protein ABL996_12340, partial [Micropepsaceae bacterium]
MRATISRTVSSIVTSPGLRAARRGWHGLGRALGGKAVVHYFHQPDDPYSQLAAQLLKPLADSYRITLQSHIVSPPDAAAAPISTTISSSARSRTKAGAKSPKPTARNCSA